MLTIQSFRERKILKHENIVSTPIFFFPFNVVKLNKKMDKLSENNKLKPKITEKNHDIYLTRET